MPIGLLWLRSASLPAARTLKHYGRADWAVVRLKLVAVSHWARLAFGPRRVGLDANGGVGESAAAVGVVSGVRRRSRTPWHPRLVVTVAASIAAVLLGVFGYVLANSQATSRDQAEQRFLAQATIAAGLTKAIFSASDAPQVQAASKSFGAATIDPRTLTALANRSRLAYVYIAGAGGRVLAASPGIPASASGTPGRPSVAISQALDGGQPWFSDLFRGPHGQYLIEQAIPFPTSFGRRVEVLAYPAALLSGFLSSYLVGALPGKTSDGFVLDGHGRIVGSSVSGVAVGRLPSAGFLAVLSSSPVASAVQGDYDVSISTGRRGARYVVAAPIGGSDWRVALTEPTSTLYPADVGSQWWVIWLVFVAFALATLGCLYLLRRSLNGAARLVEQAHQITGVNVELELQTAELEQQRGALSFERRRFEAVLEQTVGGVLVAEAPSGRIVLASNQAELILGQPLRAESFEDYLHSTVVMVDGHAIERSETPLTRALCHGETITAAAMEVRRADGTIVAVEVNAAPVRDEQDRIIAAVVTFYDVTQRKRAQDAIRSLNEQLESQNKKLELSSTELKARQADLEVLNAELEASNGELNAFSYSVSHDLRAPLRAIDGFSRIVLSDDEGTLTDSQRRYLGLVRDNTQAMGNLIDDLLSFSRLANQPLKRRTVQTAELVAEVESELIANQNGRTIEFANGNLPAVQADPALLRQVFANLLGNAVKYSGERERIRVAVDSERRDGELVFLVRDNGVGFDMRYVEKLFQVFQRLHRAEDYEGTGVGLAIVQRIITRHGGRVWAEGKPDEGATFYFTLNGGAP